jgi:hypothetical protein
MPNRQFLKPQKSGFQKRRINYYEKRLRILIVCEGAKTEPNYFNKFPHPPSSVVVVKGIGKNTETLVREAISLREKADSKYDQVWCVFDRDSFPAVNFNAALQMAKARGIEVAYSNEAFELWYLLHFCYFDTGISRKQYKDLLSRHLGYKYTKNSQNMFEQLCPHQKKAIQNAKRLLSQYRPNPAKDNPSTTVHILVERLNRLFW